MGDTYNVFNPCVSQVLWLGYVKYELRWWIFLQVLVRYLLHHLIQYYSLHVFLQTQVVDPSAKFQIVENTPDDPRKRKPDITKATALLGWEPKVHACPHFSVEWNTRDVCWTETWLIRMAGNLSFIFFMVILVKLVLSLNCAKLVWLRSNLKAAAASPMSTIYLCSKWS